MSFELQFKIQNSTSVHLSLFSKALNISLISFPPPNLEGKSLIFPLRYICHPRPASLKKSRVFNLNWRIRLSSWIRPFDLIVLRKTEWKRGISFSPALIPEWTATDLRVSMILAISILFGHGTLQV